jgi:L-fucose mutarotase
MINGNIVHPDVLAAIARAGHSSKILIADGHFPSSTLLGRDVPKVYLNYAPGLLSVTDVLRPLVASVAIEAAVGATFEDGSKPEIWADYTEILPEGLELGEVKGSQLTTLFDDRGLGLVILTGELRPASCIVLTLGIRTS